MTINNPGYRIPEHITVRVNHTTKKIQEIEEIWFETQRMKLQLELMRVS